MTLRREVKERKYRTLRSWRDRRENIRLKESTYWKERTKKKEKHQTKSDRKKEKVQKELTNDKKKRTNKNKSEKIGYPKEIFLRGGE